MNDEPQTPDPTTQGDPHEAAIDQPVPTAQKWKPIVVCEISVEGTGLYWLSGQGDLSDPELEPVWFALDGNASPTHNLSILRQVKTYSLEPGFAKEIDDLIRGYEELDDSEEPHEEPDPTDECGAESIAAPDEPTASDIQEEPESNPESDRLFLLQMWGDVEPILHGPYKTDTERLRQAKQLQKEDEGTLIRLDIDADGGPHVKPFSEAELPTLY